MFENINSIEELERMGKDLNEALEQRKAELMEAEKKESIEHDFSNNTFGYIKESFESLSPELLNKEGGKKLIAKYVKTIKENKNLKTLHKITEAIRIADKNGDAKEYVADVLSLAGNADANCSEDVKKLGAVLKEACQVIGEGCEEHLSEEKRVNESITYLATHKKSLRNLVEYSNHMRMVENYIKDNGFTYVPKDGEALDESTELVNKFNQTYENLSEESKSIVRAFNEGQLETAFEKSKAYCLECIKNKQDSLIKEENETEAAKLKETYEKVERKQFNANTSKSDVKNFISLAECVE